MRVERYILSLIVLVSGCSLQDDSPVESSHSAHPNNVLLITIDTLRADYVSCYGAGKVSTPYLDALADRGIRLSNAVVQVPLTTPSHASILTGTYPQVHQIRDVGGFILDETVPTVATVLDRIGFQTAAFVAAAVLNQRYGLNRGFQTYNDSMESTVDETKLPGVVAEVRGETVTGRAKAWLKGRDREKPFLLWVHYYDPHFPYDPPDPYLSDYPHDRYAGEVAYTDHQVGSLLEFLSGEDLTGNTLVILLADHGESLGDHGELTHGVFLYDATMHVPFIVAGPGISGGRVAAQQVRSIDVMPTILDFVGLPIPPEVQGTSLVPLLVEGRPVRTHYSYMETLYPKTQMRWSELRGMRTDRWKLIVAPRPELYDLESDRSEAENVLPQHPAEADRLQKQVWEINGPPDGAQKIEYRPLDEETQRELESLGYVSAGASREIITNLSGPDPKDKVAVLTGLERATELMNDDRFGDAVPLLDALLGQDSRNPLIYQHLGLCLQETRNFRRALEVYELAIRNEADTDRTYAEIGEIQIRMNRLDEAISAMRKSAEINPRNLDNMANLANAYLQSGKLDDAQHTVEAILAQNKSHAVAHNLMGLVYVQRREPVRARASFERAISLNPELAEGYMNLGLLARLAGDDPAAIRNFRIFLEKATGPQYAEIVPQVRDALARLESGSSSPGPGTGRE